MPTLHWIGKDKVVNHHQEVPYRVLEHKYGFRDGKQSEEETGSGNLIIHGDNLLALKALLPKYQGKVNCIYIDPPYNTGNEKWVYNDNVNEPHIKKWLGEVVGTEGEDLSRHDKWLCMMYPRLVLLQKLLSEDGAIFISIDDNEQATLKLLCDEVFGASNFIGQWMWFKSATPPNLSYKIKKNLEYILCYEKKRTNKKYSGIQKVSPSDDPLIKPQNTHKELVFPVGSIHFKGTDGVITKGTYGTQRYPSELLTDMVITNGVNANEVIFRNRFIWVQEKLESELLAGTIINCSRACVLSYKKANYDPEVPPNLIDSSVGVNTTEEAGKFLTKLFGQKVFDFPKDVSLIQYLISFQCDKDAIILDSFAGSGTTANAVLNLNRKDNGNRKFILVELSDYAEDITAERIRRVINGVEGADIEGTGGAFDFYELGEPLFREDGNLNEDVGEDKIREYIFFSETQQNLSERNPKNKYFLGSVFDTAYYFYYEPEALTTLNHETLRQIVKQRAEQYIIYADTCTLTEEEMHLLGVIFKKIPRDIKRF